VLCPQQKAGLNDESIARKRCGECSATPKKLYDATPGDQEISSNW
jgi:hypothetical protein